MAKDSSDCRSECFNTCLKVPSIPNYVCNDVCKAHCVQRLNVPQDKAACVMKCDYLKIDHGSCDRMCDINVAKHSEAKSVSSGYYLDLIIRNNQGCIGYGTETCYKRCRLINKESIQVCKCACCACTF